MTSCAASSYTWLQMCTIVVFMKTVHNPGFVQASLSAKTLVRKKLRVLLASLLLLAALIGLENTKQ